MALGDIYQVRDRALSAYGVQMENVYFYIGTGDGLADALADAFEEVIVPLVAALQPLDWNHYEIDVQSLFDLSDFTAHTLDVDGTQTTETTAPYTAINFTLRVPTRAIRPGSKRIGPVPEDVVANGVITDGDYLTLMEAFRGQMNDPIAFTGTPTATFDPVLVKRIREEVGGVVTYRLPTSFGEATYAFITGAVTNTILSHQTSRQRG